MAAPCLPFGLQGIFFYKFVICLLALYLVIAFVVYTEWFSVAESVHVSHDF